MDASLIKVIAELGISGFAVAVLAYVLYYILKEHRGERRELHESYMKDRHRSNDLLKELTDVIREVRNKS